MGWKFINLFSQNKFISTSYIYLFIVPLLATILREVQSPLYFTIFNEEVKIFFELPFKWKLFFFGALFFTVGYIVYLLASPSIIKDNKSYGSFLLDKKNFSHLDIYAEELLLTKRQHTFRTTKLRNFALNLTKKEAGQTNILENIKINFSKFEHDIQRYSVKVEAYQKFKKAKDVYIKSNGLNEVDLKLREIHSERGFWALYEYANQHNSAALLFSVFMYIFGFGAFGYVLVQSILTVINS